MHGGEIIIKPLESATYAPENVIVGNTCLYGATWQSLPTGWLVSVSAVRNPRVPP